MKFFKGIILILISVLLFLFCWFYFLGIGVERTVLNSQYYRNVSLQTDLFKTIHNNAVNKLEETLYEEMVKEGENEEEIKHKVSIMVNVFSKIFDEEWLEETFYVLIDDTLGVIKQEQENFTVTIDLESKKDELRDAFIIELKRLIEEDDTFIEITEDKKDEFVDSILEDMDFLDKIIISELIEENIDFDYKGIISDFQIYRNYLSYGYYLALFLLLGFYILITGIVRGFKWFGSVILISSLMFIVFIQIIKVIGIELLSKEFTTNVLIEFDKIKIIINYTLSRFLTIPFIYCIIGLIIIVLGIIVNKKIIKKN